MPSPGQVLKDCTIFQIIPSLYTTCHLDLDSIGPRLKLIHERFEHQIGEKSGFVKGYPTVFLMIANGPKCRLPKNGKAGVCSSTAPFCIRIHFQVAAKDSDKLAMLNLPPVDDQIPVYQWPVYREYLSMGCASQLSGSGGYLKARRPKRVGHFCPG